MDRPSPTPHGVNMLVFLLLILTLFSEIIIARFHDGSHNYEVIFLSDALIQADSNTKEKVGGTASLAKMLIG